jgi:ribonucleoside-diphosphate reductase alpha chain
MADVKGPFSEFERNRDVMLGVMRMHRDAASQLKTGGVDDAVVRAASEVWDEAVALGERHGYRNAQATVLAPTGCLVGDSLVLTDRGLVRLRKLGRTDGDQWQNLDVRVATHEGPKQATKFYVNGAEPVVTVRTGRGYQIKGTATHRIKVVDENGLWQWRRLADIRTGDRVPLMLGGLVGEPKTIELPPLADAYWTSDPDHHAPRVMSSDLAEFVGYFMGDGSLHTKGIRLCVTDGGDDVVDRLVELGRSLFGLTAAVTTKTGYREVAFNSVRLVLWWQTCGFAKVAPESGQRGKGHGAHIPDSILHSNDPAVYGAFLRGLFEADGSTTSVGYPAFSTVREAFALEVQAMLLVLGLVTTLARHEPGSNRWSQRPYWTVRLLNQAATPTFMGKVGFISSRKCAAVGHGEHPEAARFDRIPVGRDMIDRLTAEEPGLRNTMLMAYRRHGMVSRRSATALLERTDDLELRQLMSFFYDDIATVSLGEEEFTFDLSVPANVSYVANGFISHNTIGLMMDCDTTGIEPDLALVKYKKLVGGGLLKIVNNTVPAALRKLGYPEAQVKEIVDHIDENETIEGAPHLLDEHLKVFDCAFKPVNGLRSIAPMGHVRMMAAVQPFISGSQSKTVNLPTDATVEDIENVYIESWKLGLKCIAIYRDGCKRSQPLSTSLDDKKKSEQSAASPSLPATAAAAAGTIVRRRLPDERRSITHKFDVGGHEGYITVGLYDDGQPGEIFITMAKEGSTVSGLMDAFATQTSVALQYGVPLRSMVNKFSHMRFEPSGFTRNPEIPMAKSLIDYIFRWLASKFLTLEEQDAVGIVRRDPVSVEGTQNGSTHGSDEIKLVVKNPAADSSPMVAFVLDRDAPACAECGAITVRSGACYKCMNCGSTTGCS